MLKVLAVGPLVIVDDSGRRYQPVGQIAEILGLLLTARSGVSRGFLADCLWPEDDPDRTRHRLNTALWRLRHLVESNDWPSFVIVHADGTVSLSKESGYYCDVDALAEAYEMVRTTDMAAITQDQLIEIEKAVRSYRGELLHGVMSEWVFPHRDHVDRMYEQCLTLLLRNAMSRERVDEGIYWADRLLLFNPPSEEAHRALIEIYTDSGQSRRAISQFATMSGLLETELSVQPSEESVAAYRRALATDKAGQLGVLDPEIAANLQLLAKQQSLVAETLGALAEAIGTFLAQHSALTHQSQPAPRRPARA